MARLVGAFVIVGIIPLLLSGYMGYVKARNSLEEAEFAKLRLVWDAKEGELLGWFQEITDNLAFLAHTVTVRGPFESLLKSDGDPDLVAYDVQALTSFLGSFLEINPPEEGFEDFLLVDTTTGKIVFTLKRMSDLNANVNSEALKNTGLAGVCDSVSKLQEPVLSDFTIYPPTKTASAFLGIPVTGIGASTGKYLGTLIVRLNAAPMARILGLGEGSGKTTQIYVVGRDLLMRSQSRFEKDSTILAKRIDMPPVRLALQGKKDRFTNTDSSGRTTFGFASLVDFERAPQFHVEFDWVLLAEMDEREALAPTRALLSRSILIAGLAFVVVLVLASLFSRGMGKPLIGLTAVVKRIRDGDLTTDLPVAHRKDELGQLLSMFGEMVDASRLQVSRIVAGVNVLAASASEIATTVSELAGSAAHTSSAATQAATTIEQVRQTALVSKEKGKHLVQASRKAAGISASGKTAAEDTIHRMTGIKRQMESIRDSVVKLGEQSVAIEGIISFVQDLADQSNLLAVNASIEAARAGEQGKGFSVVAHEIKNLADQSREATTKVRDILKDTQQWIGTVVMATEQGAKAVEVGLEQSVSAGRAIESLSQSVMESAKTASVIEASSDQQSAGVDQVSSAMGSIDQAIRQISEGSARLKDAATDLKDLGSQLQDSVKHYKL